MTEMKNRRETFDIDDNKKSSPISDKVRNEIDALRKKGQLTPKAIMDLYNKYPNEEVLVREILNAYTKMSKKIKARAKKLAEKIYRRYRDGNKPLHEILDKMMEYKIRYKWTDSEFDEFRKEISNLLTGNRAMEIDYNQNISAYRSRINRALGNTQITVDDGLHIKDSEHGVLSEILSMYEKYQTLHRSVIMHSLLYEDCSLVAMTGRYNREKHIASNYIHPLLACMFLPKFEIFEYHMLYSNFGAIIKARYEKKPIVDEANSLLFYDITTDPNDVVCEISSPMADLKNRFKVQIHLWETVLQLRNGNYYDASPVGEFIQVLNSCRNNLYDNADLSYNQDEGSMLRRLLSVFSLRPTFIYTKPLHTIASFIAGPYSSYMGLGMGVGMGLGNEVSYGSMNQQTYPFFNQISHTVTCIPMIVFQIPPYTGTGEQVERKNLSSAINQTIWINENKTIVPKEQSIIYSKEVLIFYVNRKIQQIQIKTFSNPLSFSQLPLQMSGFQHINKYPITIPERISFRSAQETYNLRSVVANTETEIIQGERSIHLVTGCTGLIMTHRNIDRGIYDQKYYLYDPMGASFPVLHPDNPGDGYITNKPISYIDPYFTPPVEMTGGIINKSFFDRASEYGTIFIYAKPTGYTRDEYISL